MTEQTFLIVDDDQVFLDTLGRALEKKTLSGVKGYVSGKGISSVSALYS